MTTHPSDPSSPAVPSPVPPPSGRRERFRASVREFFVIVAGVLVALAAQAWWEGRQDRSLEADYLAQIRADALENLARLEAAIAQDSVAAAAADSAMLVLEGALEGTSAEQLVGWIGRLGQASEFQPVTGAHRALQETGDLRHIRSDEVRHALIAYATSLDRGTARLDQLRASVLEAVPSFARALPFMRLAFVRGPRPEEADLEGLRGDPEAAVAVFTMQAATENRLSGLRRMREATVGLLETLGP